MQPLERISIRQNLLEVMVYIERGWQSDKPVVKTGFHSLDACISLFDDGDVSLIAARPAMGKTSLLINLMMHFDESVTVHRPRLIACGLTSRVQFTIRLLSIISNIERKRLKTAQLDSGEWHRLTRMTAEIKNKPVYSDDRIRSIDSLKQRICDIEDRHGQTPLIGIDSIDQLAMYEKSSDGSVRRALIEALKALAEEHKLAIVLTDTLRSREPEPVHGRPSIADISHIARCETLLDNILLLYREAVYRPETLQDPELFEIILAKNKTGSNDNLLMAWNGASGRFEESSYIASGHST